MIYPVIILILAIIYFFIGMVTTFLWKTKDMEECDGEVLSFDEKGSMIRYIRNGRECFGEIVEMYPAGAKISIISFSDDENMIDSDLNVSTEVGSGCFCAMLTCIFYLICNGMGRAQGFLPFLLIIFSGFFAVFAGFLNGNIRAIAEEGEKIKNAELEDYLTYEFSGITLYSPIYKYEKDGEIYKLENQKFSNMRDKDLNIGSRYDLIYCKKLEKSLSVNALASHKIVYIGFTILSVLCMAGANFAI